MIEEQLCWADKSHLLFRVGHYSYINSVTILSQLHHCRWQTSLRMRGDNMVEAVTLRVRNPQKVN
jgi:hypothetical protein